MRRGKTDASNWWRAAAGQEEERRREEEEAEETEEEGPPAAAIDRSLSGNAELLTLKRRLAGGVVARRSREASCTGAQITRWMETRSMAVHGLLEVDSTRCLEYTYRL